MSTKLQHTTDYFYIHWPTVNELVSPVVGEQHKFNNVDCNYQLYVSRHAMKQLKVHICVHDHSRSQGVRVLNKKLGHMTTGIFAGRGSFLADTTLSHPTSWEDCATEAILSMGHDVPSVITKHSLICSDGAYRSDIPAERTYLLLVNTQTSK